MGGVLSTAGVGVWEGGEGCLESSGGRNKLVVGLGSGEAAWDDRRDRGDLEN